jgi:hypothetical protein
MHPSMAGGLRRGFSRKMLRDDEKDRATMPATLPQAGIVRRGPLIFSV